MTERMQRPGRIGPTTEQIRHELERVRHRKLFANTLRSTIFILIVVSATAVLIAVLLLPVLRIYGNSMNDTLDEGDIVVAVKGGNFDTGDVIAFYYNNKLLVKRVIGGEGDWVDIDESGNVYLNQNLLEEPYLESKAYGETNITLPYQVPEARLFVLGDNRDVSIDSRNTTVGCITDEQIAGKIIFRVWPLDKIGIIK